MAQRPIWRGHLRLALVSCPVALYTAKHDRGSIHFHLINPKTGNRIRMITQDAETDQPVERKDLVKGYEFKKNTYVLLNSDDFASVRVDSSAVMTIEKFVEAGSIDPLYFDTSYFLVPDSEAGQDVYAVVHKAIEPTGRIALSRVVITQRERTVALRAMKDGLVAHTLHEQRDINDAKAVFEDVTAAKSDPDMIALARQLIDRQTTAYTPSDSEDRYETRLRAMIDAKLKGEGIEEEATEEPDRSNVVDLMAALKRSLGQEAEAPKARSASKQASPSAKLPKKRVAAAATPKSRRKRA